MGRRRIHTYLLYITHKYIILYYTILKIILYYIISYYIILYYIIIWDRGKTVPPGIPKQGQQLFFYATKLRFNLGTGLTFKFDLCSNMMQKSFTSNNDPHPQQNLACTCA